MCEGRHGDLGEKKSGRSKGSGANAPQGRYTGSFGVRSVEKKNAAVKKENVRGAPWRLRRKWMQQGERRECSTGERCVWIRSDSVFGARKNNGEEKKIN